MRTNFRPVQTFCTPEVGTHISVIRKDLAHQSWDPYLCNKEGSCTPEIGTHISVIRKDLANSCLRVCLQMMLFMPIESPERVSKVGVLARKFVWMVCSGLDTFAPPMCRGPPPPPPPPSGSLPHIRQQIRSYGVQEAIDAARDLRVCTDSEAAREGQTRSRSLGPFPTSACVHQRPLRPLPRPSSQASRARASLQGWFTAGGSRTPESSATRSRM